MVVVEIFGKFNYPFLVIDGCWKISLSQGLVSELNILNTVAQAIFVPQV